MAQVYIGIELKNDSYEIDPQADAVNSLRLWDRRVLVKV
jgi:hypothetical protein